MQLYANTPSLCDVSRISCTKKKKNLMKDAAHTKDAVHTSV